MAKIEKDENVEHFALAFQIVLSKTYPPTLQILMLSRSATCSPLKPTREDFSSQSSYKPNSFSPRRSVKSTTVRQAIQEAPRRSHVKHVAIQGAHTHL